MVPLFYSIAAVIAIVGGRPGIGWCPGSCDDELVYAIIRITIAVINVCMVVEVVVAAKIRSPSCILDTCPKGISFGRIVIEAIVMSDSKSLLMSSEEDVRLCIGG